ncbi:hypothetical protein CHU92_13580 [Flavobacterium cyanobacteriorum]|uniref:Ig-like domain-containing protein n=1 Tax=Flavobacterium cyanobacteriorum TaxID=2022802 RepID=A0A255YWV0_9FLAO|nr:T9SS type A sorting domain-containing protein [Flavobacterium cyanobacteriorum]OYQ33164.1 hypothetical protein CHU92_13580 [Flavobacterium cyanobacteriorum]
MIDFYQNKYGSTPSAKSQLIKLCRFTRRFMMLAVLIACFAGNAQTLLINPAAEGGFNNGPTFPANGWTVSNSANNPWVIGTVVSNGAITGNSAYVSNTSGTTHAYDITVPTSNYFYRDITVPAGETKIILSFNWLGQGESTWDMWQVFVAPTTIIPVGSTAYPGNGLTLVPADIAGSTFVGSGNQQGTLQTATLFLPASLAGTTFRLIFYWKSDTSGGTQPPAVIDNISLTSGLPGTFISVASGNYGTPSTWDANAVPTLGDFVTISAGHTVTIDADNQGARFLTVNGTLAYATLPTGFSISENLNIANGGLVNVFNGTTGKTLTVGGNITNNGSINLSVGTTTNGSLVLNGPVVQTIGGTGTFVDNRIRNLIFANTNTATPNINWLVNNISIENNLNISNARINLGTNTLIFGISNASTGGTFTFTNGGFLPGGRFSRWWNGTQTGYTTASPTSIPTGGAGRYPFFTPEGQQRIFYLGRTSPTVGGRYTVTYNHANGLSGVNVTDGTYVISDRWDGNFQVSLDGTSPVAASFWVTIFAPNAFTAFNNNTRVMLSNSAISGTHNPGTPIPSGQRSGVSAADLLSTTGLFLGINNNDIPFTPIASGNWNDPSIWNKGTVPQCGDAVSVASGFTVTANTEGVQAALVTINPGGTLVVSAGDFTIGCSNNNNPLINNGTLTVTGGVLNINGNMVHNALSVFNHSGGEINIDGNSGSAATSVASGTAIVQINTHLINWTGGVLTIVDPHANSTASNTFAFNNSVASVNVTSGHTLRFGDGTSSDAGGNAANGFRIATFVGSGRFSFNNIIINGPATGNRHVSTTSSFGINGNLTINASGEFRDNGTIVYLNGNLVNNGSYISTGTLTFGSFLNGTAAASTNAQQLSGTGTFANSATTPTANINSLTVNNANASGVTLNVPLSVSNTLTLTSGKVNTSDANLLTLGTATLAGTLNGGSTIAYIAGPFTRTIANNNTNTNFLLFPVGKAAYAPLSLAPATTSVASIKAEAFDSNSGTANASITNLATGRRWEAPIVSGTITNINVRIGDANLVAANIPVIAPTASGEYTSALGSVATFAANTAPAVNTVTANAAIPVANYTGFISYAESNACSGTPAPGNTIVSANNICAGTEVTFSVQSGTTGSGVTYQWQSSVNGTDYTDISTATSTTFTTVPTAPLFYRLRVTCAAGPDSATSVPVQIVFSNTVASVTSASRCGTGTVTLQATPGAGADIVWFDAATAGNQVGTGNTFVTPSINTTTSYFAAARSTTAGLATIGTGTTLTGSTEQPTAFCNRWPNYWSQTIYTASELRAAGLTAGNITSMAYNIATLGDGETNANFTVRIATTGLTAFTGTTFLTSGFTTVYAPQTYTHTASGWQTIDFTTPYNWDGISNIVVEVRMDGADLLNNSQTFFTATSGNTVLWATSFTGTTTTGTLSPRRLNVRFGGQLGCLSARVPVTATVTPAPAFTLSGNAATICNGDTSPAITITAGASDYDTYVWAPATGVSGNATSGWAFNPSASTVYTLTASQTGGALCSSTATVNITVNPRPSALAISPVTNPVCNNTVVTLSATGGLTNGTVTIGTATTRTTDTEELTAFNNRRISYKSQTIYTAAELTAAGLKAGPITAITYNIATVGSASSTSAYTVRVGTTANAVFPNTTYLNEAGFATVFGPVTYNHAVGLNTITFTTPYIWDGTSNIVISVSHTGIDSTNNAQTFFTDSGANTTLFNFNNLTATTGTLSTRRFNLIFAGQVETPVTWTPATDLYTDAAATLPYVAGTGARTVYVKPSVTANTVYTATATLGSCTSVQTVTVNSTDCSIGWGNLQFPPNGTINTCGNHTIYGQVWKDGITNGPGQAAGMQAWVAVSTTNSDPATWPQSAWQPAAFNVQVGNNDEFIYNITGLSAGTYYYAFRYQYLTGPYLYGATNGPWNGTSNVNGVLTVNAINAPTANAAQSFCSGATVASLAATGTAVKWYAAATGGTALDGTTALVNGENYFASQTIDGCESTARTEVVVAINNITVTAPADVTACGSYTLPALTTGNYYTAPNGGGTLLAAGTAITSTQTIYVYAQSGTTPNCTAEDDFVVTIVNAPVAVAPDDASACESYALPALTVGNYYTQPNAGGSMLLAGDLITSTQTIYVYAQTGTTPNCTSEDSFVVTIFNAPVVVAPNDVTACGSYILPALTTGNYYTAPNGGGTVLAAGTVITSTQTIYVYAQSGTTPNCTDQDNFVVTIVNVNAPTGDTQQAITAATPEEATIEDIVVNETGVIWYPTQADAIAGTSAYAPGTQVFAGNTYWGTITVGGCTSAPLAVLITEVLSNRGFDAASFSYYPNPVKDRLNLVYATEITSVEVYNMLGQPVVKQQLNAASATVDMSALADGTYIVNVTAGDTVTTIKVVKKQ